MIGSLREKATATVGIGIVIAIIGVFAVWAGYPWLFASLGPTVALQATVPESPMSQPWNVATAHILALGAAFAAVYATGAVHVASFSDPHALSYIRIVAASMAVILALGLEFALSASHASGAATALLVYLGLIPPDWNGAISILCGVTLATMLGEALRRLQIGIRHS